MSAIPQHKKTIRRTWLSSFKTHSFDTNQDVVIERLTTSSFVSNGLCVRFRQMKCLDLFIYAEQQMTTKGLITYIVMILCAIITPAGMFVFAFPLLIGCIGGKKVRKFYFQYFFKQDDRM